MPAVQLRSCLQDSVLQSSPSSLRSLLTAVLQSSPSSLWFLLTTNEVFYHPYRPSLPIGPCFATLQLDANSLSRDSAADFADDPTRLILTLLASRMVVLGHVRRRLRRDDLTYEVSKSFVCIFPAELLLQRSLCNRSAPFRVNRVTTQKRFPLHKGRTAAVRKTKHHVLCLADVKRLPTEK